MFPHMHEKFIVRNRSRYTDHQTIGIFRLKKHTQKINKNKKLALSDCRKNKMAVLTPPPTEK